MEQEENTPIPSNAETKIENETDKTIYSEAEENIEKGEYSDDDTREFSESFSRTKHHININQQYFQSSLSDMLSDTPVSELKKVEFSQHKFNRGVKFVESHSPVLVGLTIDCEPDNIMVCDLCLDASGEDRKIFPDLFDGIQSIVGNKFPSGTSVLIVNIGKWEEYQREFDHCKINEVKTTEELDQIVLVAKDLNAPVYNTLSNMEVCDYKDQNTLNDICQSLEDLTDDDRAKFQQLIGEYKAATTDETFKNFVGKIVRCLCNASGKCHQIIQAFIADPRGGNVNDEWKEFIEDVSKSGHEAHSTALFILARFPKLTMKSFEVLFEELVVVIERPRSIKENGEEEIAPIYLTNDVYRNCRIAIFQEKGQRKVALEDDGWGDYVRRTLEYQIPAIARKLESALVEKAVKFLRQTDLIREVLSVWIKRHADDGLTSDNVELFAKFTALLTIDGAEAFNFIEKVQILQRLFQELCNSEKQFSKDDPRARIGKNMFDGLTALDHEHLPRSEFWKLLWQMCLENPSEHKDGLLLQLFLQARNDFILAKNSLLDVLHSKQFEQNAYCLPIFLLALGKAERTQFKRNEIEFEYDADFYFYDYLLRQWFVSSRLDEEGYDTLDIVDFEIPDAYARQLRTHMADFAIAAYRNVGAGGNYLRFAKLFSHENTKEHVQIQRTRFLQSGIFIWEPEIGSRAGYEILHIFTVSRLSITNWDFILKVDDCFYRGSSRPQEFRDFDTTIDQFVEFPAIVALLLCMPYENENFAVDETIKTKLQSKNVANERKSKLLKKVITQIREDLYWGLDVYSKSPYPLKLQKDRQRRLRNWRTRLSKFLKML